VEDGGGGEGLAFAGWEAAQVAGGVGGEAGRWVRGVGERGKPSGGAGVGGEGGGGEGVLG